MAEEADIVMAEMPAAESQHGGSEQALNAAEGLEKSDANQALGLYQSILDDFCECTLSAVGSAALTDQVTD